MGRWVLCLVFALVACGGDSAVKPGIPTAQLELPRVGHSVLYSLDLESLAQQYRFDVLAVEGTQVHLRAGLCAVGETGFVIDWREVKAWECAGTADGDARFLGLPDGLGYGGWTSLER